MEMEGLLPTVLSHLVFLGITMENKLKKNKSVEGLCHLYYVFLIFSLCTGTSFCEKEHTTKDKNNLPVKIYQISICLCIVCVYNV